LGVLAERVGVVGMGRLDGVGVGMGFGKE